MKKEQYIKDTFNKMTPSVEQKNKIYNNILEKYKSNDQRASIVTHKNKILKTSGIAAACAALTIFVGASIIKTAQNLDITRSVNSVYSTEQQTSSVTDVTSQFNSTEDTQTIEAPSSFSFQGEKQHVNGKTFYVATLDREKEYSFENINLSDNTSTVTPGSKLYSFPGSLISDNTLYSFYSDYDNYRLLIKSDVTTGEIIKKINLEYFYNSMCTDKEGNIYISSCESMAVYSKDLDLIYSVFREELIEKMRDNTTDLDYTDININNVAVSSEGEIYLSYFNYTSKVIGLCKLNNQYNIEFISDEFNHIGNFFEALYVLDNGNLIAFIKNDDTGSISIIEISSQTGELIADHGKTGSRTHYFGLWEHNIISADTTQSNYIYSYNIDTQTFEQISQTTDLIANAVLSDNILTIVSYEAPDRTDADDSYIFVKNSHGNMEKQISLGYPSYQIYMDVTPDETIYYVTPDFDESHIGQLATRTQTLYTFDTEFKPKKLFDFSFSSYDIASLHVSSNGGNEDVYVFIRDDRGKSRLYVYDNSGNLKSTLDIPDTIEFVSHMVQSGSELILVGYYPENDQTSMLSIDTTTLQMDEPCFLDLHSEIVSKDGCVSLSYLNEEETYSIETAVEKEQKIAEENAEKYKYKISVPASESSYVPGN